MKVRVSFCYDSHSDRRLMKITLKPLEHLLIVSILSLMLPLVGCIEFFDCSSRKKVERSERVQDQLGTQFMFPMGIFRKVEIIFEKEVLVECRALKTLQMANGTDGPRGAEIAEYRKI